MVYNGHDGKAIKNKIQNGGYKMSCESYDYKCWRCGKVLTISSKYTPVNRVFCEECKDKHIEERESLVKEYTQYKIKVMHENALRVLEKAMCYMYEFQVASQVILEDALNRPEKYNSSHEMAVAIYLESEGYYFEINYKILNYRVDFYIPDLKVCLEIDGALHNHRRKYDNRRDIAIRNELGQDWEIVRIPTKFIEQNPYKIADAIKALRNEKIKYRKENLGIITESFSNREKEHYETILDCE